MFGRGFRLGVDFGTSTTVAVLAWPDGRTRPLTFDGSPLLPSAVYAGEDGQLLAGRDARHWARRHPERFEPHPKRRVDEGTVLLGDREVGTVELFAAVLSRVAAEAERVAGGPPAQVTVTCPVSWGPRRRDLLAQAAVAAGLPRPALVDEPVAAAAYFVAVLGATLPAGANLVVYDLGAGTFDATIIARTADGFTVLTSTGLAERGGLDIDAAVVDHLRGVYAEHADAWRRLAEPAHRDAWLDLLEQVEDGKAMLSRSASTFVRLPVLDVDAPLGREQLDELARPVLDETVAAMATALREVPGPPDAVFLVGGASRMPLVSTVVHRSTGVAPVVIEQPELVVAEGALHAITATAPSTPGPAPIAGLPSAATTGLPGATTGLPDATTGLPDAATDGGGPPGLVIGSGAGAAPGAANTAPSRAWTRAARLVPADYVRPALLVLAMALVFAVGPLLATDRGFEALRTGARSPLGPAGYLPALALVAVLAAGGAARGAAFGPGAWLGTPAPPRAGRLLGLAAAACAGQLAVVTGAALLHRWTGGTLPAAGPDWPTGEGLTGVDRALPLAAIGAGLAVVGVGVSGLATRRPFDALGTGGGTGPARYAVAAATGVVLGTAALTHRYGDPADDPILYLAHPVLGAGGVTAGLLWIAAALGFLVLSAGLVFAGAALRDVVARSPQRWRVFLSGTAYGLCLTAGGYLAYHAFAEIRHRTDLVVATGEAVWRLTRWPMAAVIAVAAVAGVIASARGPRLRRTGPPRGPARRP